MGQGHEAALHMAAGGTEEAGPGAGMASHSALAPTWTPILKLQLSPFL